MSEKTTLRYHIYFEDCNESWKAYSIEDFYLKMVEKKNNFPLKISFFFFFKSKINKIPENLRNISFNENACSQNFL